MGRILDAVPIGRKGQELGRLALQVHSGVRSNGVLAINGISTPTTQHQISESDSDGQALESGFGTLIPKKPVHNQNGDMRKRKVVRGILEDQGYKCYLTGLELTPDTSTLDHIIPVSKGGHPTDARNGGFLHATVNKMKGSMSVDEFVEWCTRVSIHSGMEGSGHVQ